MLLQSIYRQENEVAVAKFLVDLQTKMLSPLDIWSPASADEVLSAERTLPCTQLVVVSESGCQSVVDAKSILETHVNVIKPDGAYVREDFYLRYGVPSYKNLKKRQRIDESQFKNALELSIKIKSACDAGYPQPWSTQLMAFTQGVLYFSALIDEASSKS